MQPGAVLVNCCRGGIVDEDALLERLESGALMAACFDVFAIEPAQCDKLLNHPNMLASPHIGASTEETRLIMVRAAHQAASTSPAWSSRRNSTGCDMSLRTHR